MKTRKIKLALIVALPITIGFTNKFTKVYKDAELPHYTEVGVTITEPKIDEYEFIDEYKSLGTFKVTYYCGGECCNGKYAGIAANGEKLKVGMCAADKSIPFGTELYLNQDGMMERYTVTDRGSAITGNHIDIYCESHEMANKLGVMYTEVFVKE